MIRFSYQPIFEDWFAFNRIVVMRQLRFINLLAILNLVAFLIYPFASGAGREDRETVLATYRNSARMLFIPGVAVFVLVATYVGVRRRWNAAAELREAREYEFDEGGVRVRTASFSSYLEWCLFKRAERRKGYFLLNTAQNQFHYFPESVVPDKDALDALLASKIETRKGKQGQAREKK